MYNRNNVPHISSCHTVSERIGLTVNLVMELFEIILIIVLVMVCGNVVRKINEKDQKGVMRYAIIAIMLGIIEAFLIIFNTVGYLKLF